MKQIKLKKPRVKIKEDFHLLESKEVHWMQSMQMINVLGTS